MIAIVKEFPGVRALDKVDLRVQPGEIHALVGENGAGKSTLMKVLSGAYPANSGEIRLRGAPVVFHNPHQARSAGISIVHQELNLVPDMTAAQNLFLGTRQGVRGMGVVDWRVRHRQARDVLGELGLVIDVDVPVRTLSVAHQQMIEIAKVLSMNADVLVMDEPTSSLTDREIERLYDVTLALKQRGVSIIYISHRLDEIFDLSDRVTILRDGRNVATESTADLTMQRLVRMMVGRDVSQVFRQRSHSAAASWEPSEAEAAALEIVSTSPHIQGIYAANDTMALAAAAALDNAHARGSLLIVGTDGTDAALRAVEAGRIDATISTFPQAIARAGLELALRALEGEWLPARYTWPSALITQRTITDAPALAGSALHAMRQRLGALPQPSRKYTIGVVLKALHSPYWVELHQGYLAAAADLGLNLVVVGADAEGDGAGQLVQAQTLLERGCDAFCLSPITSASLLPFVRQATARRLPVINVDDAEIATGVTTVLTADQEKIGRTAAEFLAQQLKAGATATMLGGLPGSSAAHGRRKGFYQAMGRNLLGAQAGKTSQRQGAAEAAPRNTLRVEGLSTTKLLRNVSFEARGGEILGIAGLVGAGRTELVRAIFGADPLLKGAIYVDGKRCTISQPRDAIRLGIGLVPEDRKSQGLVLDMAVVNNATLTVLDRISRWSVLRMGRRQSLATDYVDRLAIKTPSTRQIVRYLSGGNQQKVVIGKWLASQARILIFDEPTRGIDVGAKVEVRALMDELARQGVCIILISSELPEVLGMCDRILVLHEGRVAGEFDAAWTSEEEILQAASGLAEHVEFSN
jgi:ABC-type sugar transport system ATPase subunit